MSGATSPTLGWRPRSVIHSDVGLSTQAWTSLSSHTTLPFVSPFSVPAPCYRLPCPKFPLHFPSIPLQIRLSGGRSRYEGRVEVQIGVPGHRRWGLICGDDWGTLEAMVACRQLGLGYANHGLQVSREERRPNLFVTRVLWARTVETRPLAWELEPTASLEHPPTSPGDLVLGLRECN